MSQISFKTLKSKVSTSKMSFLFLKECTKSMSVSEVTMHTSLMPIYAIIPGMPCSIAGNKLVSWQDSCQDSYQIRTVAPLHGIQDFEYHDICVHIVVTIMQHLYNCNNRTILVTQSYDFATQLYDCGIMSPLMHFLHELPNISP